MATGSTPMTFIAPACTAPCTAFDAHPAQADDDHGVARPHPAGVDRRAPAGRDAAGDQRRGVQRQPGVDLHAGELAEQGVLRRRRRPCRSRRAARRPAGRERCRWAAAAGDRGALVAEVGPARRAEPAVPAGGQEAGDDVVARRDAGDARPHGRDDAGALVPADDRVAPARVGVPQVLVGVAEPGVGHLDEHLARARDREPRARRSRTRSPASRRTAALVRTAPMLPRRPGGSGTCPSVRGPDAGGAPSDGCLPFRRPSPPRSAPAAAPCSCTSPTRVRSTPAPPRSCARLFEVTLRGLREEAGDRRRLRRGGATGRRRLRRPAPGARRSDPPARGARSTRRIAGRDGRCRRRSAAARLADDDRRCGR